MYRDSASVSLFAEQYIQIAGAPTGVAGALIATMFDAVSADPNFLEACVRFYPNDPAGITEPLYLSSGTVRLLSSSVCLCTVSDVMFS